MLTLFSKIIDTTFQLYLQIILKEHFENMHWNQWKNDQKFAGEWDMVLLIMQ